MNKLVLGLVVGLVIGGGVTWWTLRSRPAESAPAAARPKEQPRNPLQLDAPKRAVAGIVVAKPKTATLAPEVEAFGRVLDPTPYVTLVAEVTTARAAADASAKEAERTRKLFEAGANASAQAVETADAAAARDRAALDSAEVRLLAAWGPTLAHDGQLSAVKELLTRGAAMIRIDLLPGTDVAPDPRNARVVLLGGGESYPVELVGPAPVADAQVQGRSYLAVLRGQSLPAGASLRAFLPGQGDPHPALLVPRSALVYHQGSPWVYALDQDTFTRKPVTLGRELPAGIVVTAGVGPDDRIATAGAQQLLSAELVTGDAPDER